jgi:uncharacterized protein (TIGR00304 family)
MRLEKITIGMAMVIMGFGLLMLSTVPRVEYGGVILIGPIPIIFGSSIDMAVAGIVMTVLMLLFLLTLFRWR